MRFAIPAHACEPPLPREHSFCQNVIEVADHGSSKERELLDDIERLIAASGEDVRVQPVGLRDGASYILVGIGVNIVSYLIIELIKYLVGRARDEVASRERPVIYISPMYAPKRVFRLPEEAEEAQEYFRRYPSRESPKN